MKLTILIVDDNQVAADTMGQLLRFIGYKIFIAYSGSEALALAHKKNPDIILLDIRMPDMDGYEVARQLRSDAKFHDTVLVALTGFGQDEDRQRAHQAGFNHHLTKPAGLADVKKILGQYSSKS